MEWVSNLPIIDLNFISPFLLLFGSILLKGRVTGKERKRQRGLLPAVSFSKWLQQTGLHQAEARSQETFLNRFMGPNTWAVPHCFPRCISGWGGGDCIGNGAAGIQVSVHMGCYISSFCFNLLCCESGPRTY